MPGSSAAGAALLPPPSFSTAVNVVAGMHRFRRSTSVASPRTAPTRPLVPRRLNRYKTTTTTTTITRITNTGSELKFREDHPDDAGVELVELPDGTMAPRVALYEKYVDLGPQYQVPEPEKGPLERRVSVQFLDALFSDEINEEDAAYWFTCPPEGWDIERKVLLKAKPVEVPRAQRGLRPADEPSAASRRPLLSLSVGEVLDGTVCGMALATGIHVDVGARYNGILPVKSDYHAWNKKLKGRLRMGDKCRVRVAKIIRAPLCRFPLVLEVVGEPDIMGAFMPTEEYTGAFDLRGAPDSSSSLSGNDLAIVMDSLTDGAWSGGAGFEAAAIPIPTGGGREGDMVDAERRALGGEVEEWLRKAGAGAKARAKQRRAAAEAAAASAAAHAASTSSSDGDYEEEGGGGGGEGADEGAAASALASAAAELESGGAPGASYKDDDDEDESVYSGMVLEEVDHSDLDAAIAGLW